MNPIIFKQLFMLIAFAIALTSSIEIAAAKTNGESPQALITIDADGAFSSLKAGNQRFLSGQIRKDGQSTKDIHRLLKSQAPNSIVLSCSDSRVPPEIVFDQKLGEMFTVRSAGETLSPEAIGSMEFAIEKLGSHLLVILGHTNCGAVRSAIDTIGGTSAGSDNLDKLVQDIHPRIKSKFDEKHPSKDLKDESWMNAKGVAKDLLTRSPLISKAVDSGKVKIQVGLYNLETGVVEFE